MSIEIDDEEICKVSKKTNDEILNVRKKLFVKYGLNKKEK